MNWSYKGKEVKDIGDNVLSGHYGFVYKITHIPTGKIYIGRKNLFDRRNVKLGKKELIKIKEERKLNKIQGRAPSKKLVITESNWSNYWGSNKTLLVQIKKEGEGNFERKILEFAYDKKNLTYLETKCLFVKEVLEKPDEYYNDNIQGRFYTKDFNNINT